MAQFSIRAAPCAHHPHPHSLLVLPSDVSFDCVHGENLSMRRTVDHNRANIRPANCRHDASFDRAADGADVGKRRVPAEGLAQTRLRRLPHRRRIAESWADRRFVKAAPLEYGSYRGVALDLDYLNLRVGKRTHVKRDALAIVIIYGDAPTIFLPGNDRR
jgi:hypothetical protein